MPEVSEVAIGHNIATAIGETDSPRVWVGLMEEKCLEIAEDRVDGLSDYQLDEAYGFDVGERLRALGIGRRNYTIRGEFTVTVEFEARNILAADEDAAWDLFCEEAHLSGTDDIEVDFWSSSVDGIEDAEVEVEGTENDGPNRYSCEVA
jgi:hypothetical protein